MRLLSCVIAELFLEGKHLFQLGELLSYVKGEYDPAARLRKIGDPNIEELVLHMIQRDPTQRATAEEYLQKWCDVCACRCVVLFSSSS